MTLSHKWMVIALSAWLLLVPGLPRPAAAPLAQCNGTDLQIAAVTVEPDPPLTDKPYNVHVTIVNGGNDAVNQSGSVSWVVLSLGAPPGGSPLYRTEAPVDLDGLAPGGTAVAHLTVPGEQAAGGYHYLWVRIDAENDVNESCSGGENNNLLGPITISIPIELPPTPTLTPFPLPQIYFFQPGDVTVLRGSEVTLRWQVYGDAVSVTLDGVPVPLEDTRIVVPTENHVYTLRAQNPGGTIERVSRVSIVDPTPTPCTLAVIHQLGATRTTIPRGEETTLYWDLSGATEAYLNGQGVEGVSQRTVRLEQTTVFRLVAHNACGDVEKTLTILVTYATPTLTFTPTRTPTPTFTPVPPTSTPTRNVLPTVTPTNGTPARSLTPTPDVATAPTLGAQVPTITPGVLGTPNALASPLDLPTPTLEATRTVTATVALATETPTLTPTLTPTQTPTLTPTQALATVTATSPWVIATALAANTATATPTSTVAPALAAGSTVLRLYLCPLGVLVLFAAGVLILSFVVPRLRERQQAEPVLLDEDVAFVPLSSQDPEGQPQQDDFAFEQPAEESEAEAPAEEDVSVRR